MKSKLNLNRFSLKEWRQKYHLYVNINPSNEEKLYALKVIVGLMESISKGYFISVGTCLGIYRDNEIIPWDDDIDLDMIDKEYDQSIDLIIDFALKNNFPFKRGNNLFHPKINIFINKVKVSIGKLSRGHFKKNILFRPKTKIPYRMVYPTRTFVFKETNLRIPNNPKAYLNYIYGESWIKPIKWEGKDQYKSAYERTGLVYSLLDTLQLIISKVIKNIFLKNCKIL